MKQRKNSVVAGLLATVVGVGTALAAPVPKVVPAMDRAVIEAGLKSHDRALYVKEGWIRDPFIVLGPDGWFYLTGTTPNPGDPREQSDPYNVGIGEDSVVGWKAQVWRSRDLIDWESRGTPFTLKDGIWFQQQPEKFKQMDERQWRLWAPELHWLGDRWALIHTSPTPVKGANLSLSAGGEITGPWENPLGAKIQKRHDPSLFKDDDGTWWMIWGATEIAPLKPDFSDFAGESMRIGPSGTTSKMGHEGCLIKKIHGKYVLFGTGWSTGKGRKGSYNLYYATADKITGPYSERKFAGRFLGHGTPFQDKEGRWWCTAFYNANVPPLSREGIETRDLGETAQTINQRGTTLVPLEVRSLENGELYIRAKDPAYATPGPDEAQDFSKNKGGGLAALPSARALSNDWKPVAGAMLTPWGERLDPAKVWTEYPRPQLERGQWTNLNGLWEYAVTGKEAGQPGQWTGEILVPFAIEAPLSGVGRRVSPEEALWYRRTVAVEKEAGRRYLLNFEAVDYQSTLWVNGKEVGSHTGGNLPFSFDVTDALKAGGNTLVLRVLDATDAPDTYQLQGKQKNDNKGIWYTPVSGIWQTVWMESVPSSYIESLRIETKVSGEIKITPVIKGAGTIHSTASFGGKKVAEGGAVLNIAKPACWSPSEPNLYDLKVELLDRNGKVIDQVASYAGIREVGKAKDADGNWRFTLNGEQIFHWGPLDQGWWPDGLLTPPSAEAMVSDIHFLRDAGFNMIRKHIKVEPRRYYYECDRLGMLIWQDQVSGGTNPLWTRLASQKKNPPEGTPLNAEWPDAAHDQWMVELKGMVDHLRNHPSIVVWTPFNERWGQHRSLEIGKWIAAYDPSRLINIASGGNFFPVGDIADEHNYPSPAFPLDQPEYDAYIKVVGEFGGHGWPVDGHLWNKEKRNWGYGGLPQTVDEYKMRYRQTIRTLAELKAKAVAAGVYTQTTDVEGEINGLITYDRKVQKMSAAELKDIHEILKRPPPVRTTVITPGKDAPQMWKYTTEQPAAGWNQAGFDDSAWKQGPTGFGAKGTPNATIKTDWKTQDIWLRKEFELQDDGGFLELEMYYDEDPVIFINGIKAAEPKGYTTGYVSMALSDQAAAALRKGKNTIAVHCRNTQGGQFIDLGLIHFKVPAGK